MNLPYNDGSFDMILCLGVIQHTPSSSKTFRELIRVLKPGGFIVWDHYEFGLRRYTKVPVLLLRPIIKRLPSKIQLWVCAALVKVFLPAHKFIATRSTLLQKIFSRFSPITSYFHVYPELTDKQQETWSFLDTHDTLTAWHENWLTKKQANQLVSGSGATVVSLRSGGNGIEAVSMKLDQSK